MVIPIPYFLNKYKRTEYCVNLSSAHYFSRVFIDSLKRIVENSRQQCERYLCVQDLGQVAASCKFPRPFFFSYQLLSQFDPFEAVKTYTSQEICLEI